jgi:NADH-quinone oxidoreductase subunit J
MGPKEVGLLLFGPYMLLVEIAALLLLSALVGAFHIGRRHKERAQ